MDWIVKTFRGYIFEDYNQIGLENTMNSIIIPSIECLKFFVGKISRIKQNLQKPRNFHPSKMIHYTVAAVVSIVCRNKVCCGNYPNNELITANAV